MTPHGQPRRPGGRRLRWILASTLTVLALATVALVLTPGFRGAQQLAPTTEGPTRPTDQGSVSDDGAAYRPQVHLTPSEHWMNDPQRPIVIDGLWHFYYLYNADYPDGNGTEWYHVTSNDLVHWRDEGVAIEKYRNGLGDIETGSVVVDEHGTAGFGQDAVLAIVTQQHEGVQRQSLFVSKDGGYTFADSGLNPVLDNPGTQHFRDPKVFWDATTGRWTMALAEGNKIGFYSSPDLRTWTYLSGFQRDDVGLLECPDLFPLAVDGDPDRVKWILLSGANGESYGKPHGTAYWVGEWDGTSFTPDSAEPRWLDHGSDFYATVTWDDPTVEADKVLDSRYAIGWMNNWSYAEDLPTEAWHGGQDSIVRSIRLTTRDADPALVSTPVDTLANLEDAPAINMNFTVHGGSTTEIGVEPSGAYRLRATVDLTDSAGIDELRFHLGEQPASALTFGYDVAARRVFLVRDADSVAQRMPEEYRQIRTAEISAETNLLTFDVIVDESSIEMFVNDGEATLSSLVYLQPGRDNMSLQAIGNGTAEISDLTVTPLHLDPAQQMGQPE
ncbi:2,6-beta-fructan 6-levanbiohydrolase [Zhihengliuella somnathii]